MPGPPPIPQDVLAARGSWRAKTRGAMPCVAPGAPVCPIWLPTEAREVWARLVPELEALGVLAAIDANALARYCVTWVRWRAAELALEVGGSTFVAKSGAPRPRPEVAIATTLAAALGKLERDLYMTPSSRSRLVVAAPRVESDGEKKIKKFKLS